MLLNISLSFKHVVFHTRKPCLYKYYQAIIHSHIHIHAVVSVILFFFCGFCSFHILFFGLIHTSTVLSVT